jgi:hypothetical protein
MEFWPMTERTTLDFRPHDHKQRRKTFTEEGIPVPEGDLLSFEEHRIKAWLAENCGQAPASDGLEVKEIVK